MKILVPPIRRGRSLVLNRQEWRFPGSPSVIGLLGINGAGKSSFFLALAGLLEGREAPVITLNGQASDSFSFLPQTPALPSWLTTEEVVATYGRTLPDLKARFPGLLLNELEGKPVSHLSEGQAQALALTLTLGAGAEVTLLDEPLSALDLRRRRGFRRHLSEWRNSAAREGLVILSTQSVSEVMDHCDAIVVLHEGECRYCGSLEELARGAGHHFQDGPVPGGSPGSGGTEAGNPPPDAEDIQATVEDSLVRLLS